MRRRILYGTAGCALFAAFVGCTQVLGLDPPKLDPCAEDGCFDAADFPPDDPGPALSVGKTDAAVHPSPPPFDAGAPDTAPPPRLIRCGGEQSPLSYCNQATQTCCGTPDVNGSLTFACIPQASTCPGIPISCARQADCDPSAICCVTDSIQSCVSRGTCATYVCDPATSADCPPGTMCQRFADPSDPYYACR